MGGGIEWTLISETHITGTNTTSSENNTIHPNINISGYKELLITVSYYKDSDGYAIRNSTQAPVSDANIDSGRTISTNWLVADNGMLNATAIIRNYVIDDLRAYLNNTGINHSGYTCYAKLYAR